MPVKHKQAEGRRIIYAGEEGNTASELGYGIPSANKMIIEHAEVHDSLENAYAGPEWVGTAVQDLKARQIKIVSLCTFLKSVMEASPEMRKVLHSQHRMYTSRGKVWGDLI